MKRVLNLWFKTQDGPSIYSINTTLLTFYFSFNKLFVVAAWFYCCFLFFLKFPLSLLGCLPCCGLPGSWHLAFQVGVCSLECNNNNGYNNNDNNNNN